MKKLIGTMISLMFIVGCGDGTYEKGLYVNENEDNMIDEVQKDETSNDEVGSGEVTRKSEFSAKLTEIENGLTEFYKLLENGSTVEMTDAQGEIFKRWDTALNEIYRVLKSELSTSEMSKLREEQRKWITYRDKEAKEQALKFDGGTMESLEYISTQVRLTKERCYELVDKYMR